MFRLPLLLILLATALPVPAAEVLASIRPLALIARVVAGEQSQVQQLVPDGVSSHDYSLRPSDRRRLQQAGVLLWLGPAHEHFLEKPVSAVPGKVLTVQRLPSVRLLMARRLADGSAGAGIDPHIWLDPDNAIAIARQLAETLARLEPARAASYRENAAAFARRVQASQQPWQEAIGRLPNRRYLAYHDAYQYLEKPLGLGFAGALTAGHEQPPGARHLALLATRIKAEGIHCLLAEPGFDEALARRVFNGQPGGFFAVDEMFTAAASYEDGLARVSRAIHDCLK